MKSPESNHSILWQATTQVPSSFSPTTDTSTVPISTTLVGTTGAIMDNEVPVSTDERINTTSEYR